LKSHLLWKWSAETHWPSAIIPLRVCRADVTTQSIWVRSNHYLMHFCPVCQVKLHFLFQFFVLELADRTKQKYIDINVKINVPYLCVCIHLHVNDNQK
jgi:hypothetical protein